jgi:hypothetical protein
MHQNAPRFENSSLATASTTTSQNSAATTDSPMLQVPASQQINKNHLPNKQRSTSHKQDVDHVSDAAISCPCCFTLLAVDTQQYAFALGDDFFFQTRIL